MKATSYPKENIKAVKIPERGGWPAEMFTMPEWAKPYLECVLIPEGMINDRTERLAQDIHNTYKDEDELTFVVVMNVPHKYQPHVGIGPLLQRAADRHAESHVGHPFQAPLHHRICEDVLVPGNEVGDPQDGEPQHGTCSRPPRSDH